MYHKQGFGTYRIRDFIPNIILSQFVNLDFTLKLQGQHIKGKT